MSEFTHYQGCKGDPENCSACALTKADKNGPNYAAWPLAYMQNGIRIPQRYHDALLAELGRTDNPAYVENLKTQLKAHGYDVDVIRNARLGKAQE